MKSITMEALVGDKGVLQLTLPDDFTCGKVKVIVQLEEPVDQLDEGDEDFKRLMKMRRKYGYDRATVQQIVKEGREHGRCPVRLTN